MWCITGIIVFTWIMICISMVLIIFFTWYKWWTRWTKRFPFGVSLVLTSRMVLTYFMNESSPVYILLVRCLILLVIIFGFFFLHIPNSTKTYHLLNTKQDSKNKKTEEGIVVSMKPGEYLINLVKNAVSHHFMLF